MKFLQPWTNTPLLLLFAILFLFACSGHKKVNDGKTYKYRCEDGAEFTANIHQYGDQVIVRKDNKHYILDITPSASGEKYTDGMNTFFSKGDESVLEIDGDKEYRGCKVIK